MTTDRIIFVCTIIVAVVYLYATTLIPSLEIGDPLGPKAFPRLLGICLLVAAAFLFAEQWKERKTAGAAAEKEKAVDRDLRHLPVLAGVVVWFAVYFAVFERLGYLVATTIFLLALMAWFHRGRWLANIASSILFSVVSYYMFVKLEVSLPKGILPF